MTIRRNKKERGQALAELTAALIGIMFVIMGILLVCVLGLSGVRNMIDARESADYAAQYRLSGDSGKHISTINAQDGLRFTSQDTVVSGQTPSSAPFVTQLEDNTHTFTTEEFGQTAYSTSGFNSQFQSSDIFISAADLTSAQKVISDPFAEYQLFDAERWLKTLGIPEEFSIKDAVYMPNHQTEE